MKRAIYVCSGLVLFALAVCSAQAECARVEIKVDPGEKSICIKPWVVDVFKSPAKAGEYKLH